jgi:hypothetical protein
MDKKYQCEICNKFYSTPSSFSNHKKIYHTKIEKNGGEYCCRYCNKCYIKRQSRWFHEKKCKIVTNKILEENQKLKEEISVQKEEVSVQKDKIIKLQEKLIKTGRLTTKSFKAINKILMERSYANQSHNNNSFNQITNNNIQICNIGREEVLQVLTNKQKKQIMNSRLNALDKLVEITHCGEYNQFKNIVITNLKDKFAYKYDSEKGYFIAVKKEKLLDEIISYRNLNLEELCENEKLVDEKTREIVRRFLDKCESDETFVDENGVSYPNYKSYKKDCIMIILYNSHEKITKDIAHFISSGI